MTKLREPPASGARVAQKDIFFQKIVLRHMLVTLGKHTCLALVELILSGGEVLVNTRLGGFFDEKRGQAAARSDQQASLNWAVFGF